MKQRKDTLIRRGTLHTIFLERFPTIIKQFSYNCAQSKNLASVTRLAQFKEGDVLIAEVDEKKTYRKLPKVCFVSRRPNLFPVK